MAKKKSSGPLRVCVLPGGDVIERSLRRRCSYCHAVTVKRNCEECGLSPEAAQEQDQKMLDRFHSPEGQLEARDRHMAEYLRLLGPMQFCLSGYIGWKRVAAEHGFDIEAIDKKIRARRAELERSAIERPAQWAERDAELAEIAARNALLPADWQEPEHG